MTHFDNIASLVNTLQQKSGHKNEKLRLLRIILNRPTYLSTFTKTLRNDTEIKHQFKNDDNNTSSYVTVAGEFLLNFITDAYEDSLYSLTNEEKQRLIQKINGILNEL